MNFPRWLPAALFGGALLCGCAVSRFTYYQPEKGEFLVADRWGAERVYFREIAPDVFLYLATTEHSEGRTLLLRLSLPFSQQIDASGAVWLVGAKEEERVPIVFSRGLVTVAMCVHPSDIPDRDYSTLPVPPRPPREVWTHQLVEARLPLSGSPEATVTIRGLRVGDRLLEPVSLKLTLKSKSFMRTVQLQ